MRRYIMNNEKFVSWNHKNSVSSQDGRLNMPLFPHAMFNVTLTNYLQQSFYLILTIELLAGCGRTQVEPILTSRLVPPTSTPTPTLIQHTRDYWPTEGWI